LDNGVVNKNFVVKVKEKKMANRKFQLGILIMVLVFGMMIVGCEDGESNTYTPDPPLPKGGTLIIHNDVSSTFGLGWSLYFDLWLNGRQDYNKERLSPGKSYNVFDGNSGMDMTYSYKLYVHTDYDFNKPLKDWDSGSGTLSNGRTVNIYR
jgi:hypothetical protein